MKLESFKEFFKKKSKANDFLSDEDYNKIKAAMKKENPSIKPEALGPHKDGATIMDNNEDEWIWNRKTNKLKLINH